MNPKPGSLMGRSEIFGAFPSMENAMQHLQLISNKKHLPMQYLSGIRPGSEPQGIAEQYMLILHAWGTVQPASFFLLTAFSFLLIFLDLITMCPDSAGFNAFSLSPDHSILYKKRSHSSKLVPSAQTINGLIICLPDRAALYLQISACGCSVLLSSPTSLICVLAGGLSQPSHLNVDNCLLEHQTY